MKFKVRELRKAKADKRHIFEWLYERSPQGAAAWLAAYDETIEWLKSNADTYAGCYENADLDMDVKEILFKTRRGRVYRALFVIEGDEVFVLRVRGPGQAPIQPNDLEGP
jgi:plasmid stabilization system protein ParE